MLGAPLLLRVAGTVAVTEMAVVVAHSAVANLAVDAGLTADADAATPAPRSSVAMAACRRFVGSVRWYVREFFGDSAYERYVARHEAVHAADGGLADHPIMTEREFWRERDRDAESQVETGCC